MSHQPIHQVTTSIIEGVAYRLWGFRPNLMPHIVKQQGPFRALVWFMTNMPRYERTLSALGPVRTHAFCSGISLLNGCPYCLYSHVYAFQLHYLREQKQLFSLNDQDVLGLLSLDAAALQRQWASALANAGLTTEANDFQRLLAFRDGASPKNDEDRRLQHLLEMLSVLNTCAVQSNVEMDEAHDPINKDLEWKAHYAALREKEQSASGT